MPDADAEFDATLTGWRWSISVGDDEEYYKVTHCESFEAGQLACFEHYRAAIRSCFQAGTEPK